MKVSGELYVEEEWDEKKQTKQTKRHAELYGKKTDPEQSSFKFAVLKLLMWFLWEKKQNKTNKNHNKQIKNHKAQNKQNTEC